MNIFVKSTEAERCTDVMFRLTLYCLSGTYIGWTRWNGDTTSKNKLYIYISNIVSTHYFVALDSTLGTW